ncbi:MAG: hypothetical protein R2705_13930 [Ilumatobacteraceae bacterium]
MTDQQAYAAERTSGTSDEGARHLPTAALRRAPQRPRWGTLGMPAEKSKNFQGTLAQLWELLGTERPLLVVVVILVIGGTALTVVGPRLSGRP